MSLRLSIILLAVLAAGCTSDEESLRAAGQTGLAPVGGRSTPGVSVLREDRIRAVVLDARERPSDSTLAAIRGLGATHVALVSFGFQQAVDHPEIRHTRDARWHTESEAGIRELAARLDPLGIGIILKPQIWVRHGAWTAGIDFGSDRAWNAWESDYREYLLRIAELAEDVQADLLIIGTELGTPVRERAGFWRSLIGEIRGVYDGKLTYGANWHDDYQDVSLWKALDYIGVQAYFPLSRSDDPSLDDLKAGWADHLEDLRRLSREVGRPVLFTELGYRSVSHAAAEPWRWPSRDEAAEPDFDRQADLFRAFFEAAWPQPWFGGAVIWKFYPDGRQARHWAVDFTPQNKPAERVIRQFFTK